MRSARLSTFPSRILPRWRFSLTVDSADVNPKRGVFLLTSGLVEATAGEKSHLSLNTVNTHGSRLIFSIISSVEQVLPIDLLIAV